MPLREGGWEAQLHLEHEERRKEEFVIDLFRRRTSIWSTYKGVKVDLVTAQEKMICHGSNKIMKGKVKGISLFSGININTNDNM